MISDPNRQPRLCECGGHGFASLTRWGVMLFDAPDLAALAGRAWTAERRRGVTYAATGNRGGRLYAHRVVAGPEGQDVVDHANHDGTDNRRENLRVCARRHNSANARMRQPGKTGFKGVHKRGRRFIAVCSIGGRWTRLGSFETAEAAARAYDAEALRRAPEFACTNAMLGLLDRRPLSEGAAA